MILKVMQPVLSRLQSLGQNCLSSRGSEIGGRGRLLSASEGDDEGESVGERWEISEFYFIYMPLTVSDLLSCACSRGMWRKRVAFVQPSVCSSFLDLRPQLRVQSIYSSL